MEFGKVMNKPYTDAEVKNKDNEMFIYLGIGLGYAAWIVFECCWLMPHFFTDGLNFGIIHIRPWMMQTLLMCLPFIILVTLGIIALQLFIWWIGREYGKEASN
jgi:hypothetical protein